MPVNSPHSKYLTLLPLWLRARDVVGGRHKIIAGGEAYAPKPTGLSTKEFEAYLGRGSWYGATRRTVDGMSGLIFRREPTVVVPAGYEYLVDVASPAGTSLHELADAAIEQVLTVGRYGVLVDFPQIDTTQPRTVAQVEGAGDRPYLATYVAESIINWRWRVSKSRRFLDRVILEETKTSPDPEDEFVEITSTIYRELALDDAGFYYQRVWEIAPGEKEYSAGTPFYPQLANAPMFYIPFQCVTVLGDDIDSETLPLNDLIELNLDHWRNSLDYEHGLHFTGCPTPVITGYEAGPGEVITIGSETCLVLSDPQAKATYMEFTGAGLSANVTAMQEKKKDMATVGSRLLMEDPKGVEAAQTAAIHRSGENSVLGSISQSASKVLTRAYQTMVEWAGGDPAEVTIGLNTDFLPFTMPADMIGALVAAQQAGMFSKQTLFTKLQEGEVIPAGVGFDQDMLLILEEGMLGLPNAPSEPDA